jgi:hypothetical protein
MEHIHLWQVVVILILIGVFVYNRRRLAPPAKGSRPPAGRSGAKAKETAEETFLRLRRQALATDPRTLGLVEELKPDTTFGALMEMGIASSVVTLACFADGDARVLYKSGGGMIGGGDHEAVRKAAKEFLALAQRALPGMTRATDHSVPAPGRVRFFALTPRGVFATETDRQALGSSRSGLASLFYSGQEVVTQMREIQEQKSLGARAPLPLDDAPAAPG